MKRIEELLFIRNEDNKIEIDAEIYNILVSNQEETMEMIVEAIKDLWKNNRKAVIGAGIVVVILIIAALQGFMLDGILKRKHSCYLCTNQERVSL